MRRILQFYTDSECCNRSAYLMKSPCKGVVIFPNVSKELAAHFTTPLTIYFAY